MYLKCFKTFVYHHWLVVNVLFSCLTVWRDVASVPESPRSENLQIVQIGTSLRLLSSAQSVFFNLATETRKSADWSLCQGSEAILQTGWNRFRRKDYTHQGVACGWNTNMKADQRGWASEMLMCVCVAHCFAQSLILVPFCIFVARFLPWSVHI